MTENDHYSIKQITYQEALDCWHVAENTAVFNHPDFLARISHNVIWYLGYRKDVPIILWPVCFDAQNKASLPPHTFHVGPVWLNNDIRNAVYRWFYDYLSLAQLFIETFKNNYGGFHADLPFGVLDVRPFQQYNIEHPKQTPVDIQVRYTSRIQGLLSLTDDGIYDLMKRDRRKKIRQQEARALFAAASDWSEDELLTFYAEFLTMKQMPGMEHRLAYFKNILELTKQFESDILFFRETATRQAGACYIILYSRGVANGIYALFSDSFRRGAYSPWVMFQLLKAVRNKGYDIFDFNGGNHANLAHDKHSYGAIAFPYFRVSLKA